MVFIISIAQLKDITPIDGNVDETLFSQSVLYCQEIYLKDIVGTGLYNELVAQVTLEPVTPGSITALNLTLINDYLQPAMRFYIMAEMVRPLAIRFANVGMMQNNTTHSQPITGVDLTKTEDHYRNRAETLATRASDYLCANATSYPLYENPGDSGDTIHPKHEQFTSSMYFGNEKNCRRH